MRARAQFVLGGVGLLLVALGLQGSILPSSWSPYLVVVGAGMFTIAAFLTVSPERGRVFLRTMRVTMGGSSNTQNVAARDVNIYQTPTKTAPSEGAELAIRSAGNAATEGWVRWFHVVAAITSDVVISDAKVHVTPRGSQAGPEQWRWQGGGETTEIRRVGARIPLVIGAVSQRNEPLTTGWYVNAGNWYLTPSAHAAIGRYLANFVPRARHVFDVSVTWTEDSRERRVEESFELRFWRQMGSEPRFIRIGDRPTYRDQAGALVELREDGVSLLNEGLSLDQGAFADWQRKLKSWSEETREVIGEASASDAGFFWTLKDFPLVEFPTVTPRDPERLLELRCHNERLERLQRFMREGGL